MQDTKWTATGTGYEPRSARSASSSTQRPDLRWGRLTFAQLRDEEFLAKQLRRLEITHGARRAGRPTPDAASVTGLAPGKTIRQRLLAAQTKASRGTSEDEDFDAKEETLADLALKQAADRDAEDRHERELTNALCVLGNLPQPELAALMVAKLKDALQRTCTFPNPVYQLIALRRQLMKSMHEAVAAQHRQRKAAEQLNLAITKCLETGPSSDATSVLPADAAGALSGLTTTIKPREKAAREAALGIQVLVCLLSDLHDPGVATLAQRREFLEDLLPLLRTMGFLVLSPRRSPGGNLLGLNPQTSRGSSRCLGPAGSLPGAADIAEFTDKIQRFLLDMCPRPTPFPLSSPKLPAISSGSGELEVLDRTNAVNGLIHLAAATGSVRDFLVVLRVLLGASDHADLTAKELRSSLSSRSLLTSSVPSLATVRMEELRPSPINSSRNDDEVTQVKLTVRPDSSKPQRGSPRSKRETEDNAVQDPLRRKTILKGIKTGTNAGATTVSLAMPHSSSPHHRLLYSSPGNNLVSKQRAKEELKDVLLGNASLSLDMSKMKGDTAASVVTTRSETPVVTARCPKFKALDVQSVLAELDRAKPTAPTRTSRTKPTSSFHAGCFGNDASVFAGDEDEGDREVWSCGQNSYGELGHGDTASRKSFERIESLQQKDIVQVGAGNEHTIALTADGKVLTCGYNDNGQCGQGGTARVSHLSEMPKMGDNTITQVHAYNGCEHTILVSMDGRAATCGYNYRGQLGHGNTASESVPKMVRSLENRIVRLVSCSYYHTVMACEEDGGGQQYVYTFGRNDYGQLGHNDSIDRKVPQHVEALSDHQVVSVACGQYHTMVVTATGKAFAFGKNDYGQLGIDSMENQLVPVQVRNGLEKQECLEIRCGYYHSVVLCSGAHLFAFGRNDYGQLGLGRANASSTANLQLQQQRYSYARLIEELEGKDIVRLACGCYHTVAVSDNGVMYVFGRNNHGQLGTGDTNERVYPFPIDDFVGKRVALVAAGFYHTVVLTGGKDDDKNEQDAANNDKGEGSSGSALNGVTFSSILSNAAVQELVDPSKRPELDNSSAMTKAAASNEAPAIDPTDDDFRDEDSLVGGAGNDSGSASKLPTDSADALFVAVVLMAQLDRLCQPFLPKPGSYPVLHHATMGVIDSLVANATASSASCFDLSGVFEGSFEVFGVHNCSSTFDSIAVLLKHLSTRKLEPASQLTASLVQEASAASATPRRAQPSPASHLQMYLLLACIRILQANLSQLLRSGMAKAVILLSQDAVAREAGVNPWTKELDRTRVALLQIREVLLALVDIKHRRHVCYVLDNAPSEGENATRVADEATATLMQGFELFFPCQCLQRQFFMNTMLDLSSKQRENRSCGALCRRDLWSVDGFPKSKALLLEPLLRRIAEDSLMIRFVPLESATFPTEERQEGSVSQVYHLLLDRVAADFTRRLGEAAAVGPSSAVRPRQDSTLRAVVDTLSAIQKHLSSWAASVHEWVLKERTEVSTSFEAQVASVVDRCFRVDERDLDHVPSAWRCFIEFALATMGQCCEVLGQLLSMESIPSPTDGYDHAGLQENSLHTKMLETVEHSIVGQLLPLLVVSLFEFSNNPLFAAALLPTVKSLLQLLDGFNSRDSAALDAERTFVESVASSVCPRPTQRESGGSFRRKSDGNLLGSARDEDGKLTNRKTPTTANALALPWHYRLEKELAVLAAEMAVTLVMGDPYFVFDDLEKLSEHWLSSPLFRGGLSSKYVTQSIRHGGNQRSADTSKHARVVEHSPFPAAAAALPEAMSLHLQPFSLILPPPPVKQDTEPRWTLPTEENYGELIRFEAVRGFLSSLQGLGIADASHVAASKLCEWVRDSYARRDASYRMIMRQSQLSMKLKASSNSAERSVHENDFKLEAAFFAVLLHHNVLVSSAFHFALAIDRSTADTRSSPPRAFLSLWHCVAQLRRRVASKKTEINNAPSEEYESPRTSSTERILALQQTILDRCELLLLVDVYDEQEHLNLQLDAGFIAPYDPGFLVSASSSFQFSASSAKRHLHASYTDEKLPFLAAFPDSKWRKVRVLLHTMIRWKAVATAFQTDRQAISQEALAFVTSEDAVSSRNAINSLLVDPCRRVSCSVRGLESLWELLTLASFNSIQADIVHQVTQVFVFQKSTHSMLTGSQNVGYFYSSLESEAFAEFLNQLTEMMTDKAAELMEAGETEATTSFWVVIALLSVWGVHFTAEQFEFVSDVGILGVIQEMLRGLSSKRGADSIGDSSSTIPSVDSIVGRSGGQPTLAQLTVQKQFWRLEETLWVLFRYILVHCAVQNVDPTQQQVLVPTFPVLSGVAELLYTEAALVSSPLLPLQAGDSTSTGKVESSIAVAPVAIRRSFEAITLPQRFSSHSKGLTVSYDDMISPSGSKPNTPMSPLLKPNEFSVTTWLYINTSPSTRSQTADGDEFNVSLELPDRQLVFLRGAGREVSLYVVLVPESADNWQLEVGILMDLNREADAAEFTVKGRMWERVLSKQVVAGGRWLHVAVVLEATKLRLYLNGVLDCQRSLAAQSVPVWAAGSVDLPLHFGRFPAAETSVVSSAIGFLMRSLGIVKGAGWDQAMALSNNVPEQKAAAFRCLDGWLCHFRFHNRSLSPIHVRIVFDEKKSPLSSVTDATLTTTAKVVELHALLLLLASSSEGLVHFSSQYSRWMRLLWGTLLGSNSVDVQQSALRVLGSLTPLQHPLEASKVLVQGLNPEALGFDCLEDVFVQQVIRMIGFCVTKCSSLAASSDATVVPWSLMAARGIHGNQFSPEVRGSSEQQTDLQNDVELQYQSSKRQCLMLASELCQLLQQLFRCSNGAWRQSITSVTARLSQHFSGVQDDPEQLDSHALEFGKRRLSLSAVRRVESRGCFFFLGGAVEFLRPGVAVEMKGSREPTQVLSLQYNNCSPSSPETSSSAKQPAQDTMAFVHIDNDSKAVGLTWYERVFDCEAFPSCSKVNVDELKQTEASNPNVDRNTHSSIIFDVALPGSDDELLKALVDKADEVIPAVYSSKGQKTRSSELSSVNAGCLLLKVLVQAAGTSAGVDELLAKPELLDVVAELAVSQDGNPKHETLRQVERRVSALRRELYTVLVELGEAGEAELERWDESSSKTDTLTENRPGSRGLSTARRSFLLSQSDAVGSSETGLADAEDDDPANENWDPAMGDDEPSVSMQDDEDEDDEDDESLEDVDNEEEEDDEAEETRAEFVEELMLMGFPEDWCVLALKQTENDIVSASAWIVDNLEYLSKLQSTLDKERDKGRDSPRFDEEVDDVLADDTRSSSSHPPPLNSSNSWTQSVAWRQSDEITQLSDVAGGTSPAKPSFSGSEGGEFTPPPLNDKEMGRKLFGEMYFPFEDGGFLSNTKSRFMRSWRSDAIEMKGKTSPPTPQPINDTTSGTPPAFDEDFSTEIDLLDLRGLIEQLGRFERTLSILYARQFMVTLLYQTTASRLNADTTPSLKISYAQWFQLQKLVLLRGDQFKVVARANSTSAQLHEVPVDDVFSRAFRCFYDRDAATFTATAFEFCLESMDAASSSKNYEAVLWTQRELQRPDRTVAEEPGVEVVVWLLDLLLIPANNTSFSLSASSVASVLCRLRCCLGTTNLPLKFVVLRTISRLLSTSPTTENVTDEAQLVASEFLTAATVRHSRELVQGRLLFSQYLQGYVELLHVLQHRTRGGDTSVSRSLLTRTERDESLLQSAVSLLPPSAPTSPKTDGSSLLFDRKRSRSSLLAFADDGLSVLYSGNEVWKAACAVVGFSTGVHSWSVRIEKSTSPYLFVGVAARQANLDSFLGADDQSWGFIGDKALYYQRNRVRAYGETFTEGDCIGLRLDCEKGELCFSKNGVDLGLAFDNIVGEVCPAVAFYSRHQKISFVRDSCVSISGTSESLIAATGEDGTASVGDCLTACEILHNWVDSKPMRAATATAAFKMTTEWLAGSTKFVTTRSGKSLWVNVTRDACGKLGFYAHDRVRTPRGNGVVVGVAGGRVWVEVDNEPGAWFFHPAKLRVLTMASATSSSLPIPPVNDSCSSEDVKPSEGTEAPSPPFSLSSEDLVEYGEHPLWSLAVDRELLSVVNDFCEISRVSPWNLTPNELLNLVKEKTSALELTCAGGLLSMPQTKLEKLVVARFALLRFCNMYVSRSLPFFDLTWLYFQSDSNSLPCRLVSQCRGSLFVCVKNTLWTALMEKTANSPKRADDEYDYPEDLPQLQVNRLKAAAAKCHEGTVSSLFSSLFGQAFEELHFLPLKTLRMVYSHPMDDGQLRSFKVKFEGEGVDDYGGPYREFFSQFFAELQMLHVPETEKQSNQTSNGSGPSSTSLKLDPGMTVSSCVLPFLMPSPNWRNGVGANREKFVLNGALISKDTGTTATISSPGESAEEKRQLYCEMFFFLGQMIGTCLRTRVCVRLDLAMSVWKQLVAEDDSSPESALETLKEIDFVAYSLWKTLRGVLDEFKRLPTRRQDLDEQLEAMDLTFTTVLSDGRPVELREDGSNTLVTLSNLETYLDAMLRGRVQETREVMNIIKQGLHSIMPVSALALLTWTELEKRMCGVAEVDVKLLQANTEYDEELSPNDEFIQRFWRVLESLEAEDKRAFLRFVWARSRLPLGSAQFHQKFKIQALASSGTGDGSSSGGGAATGGWMDSQMPKSHTCFFALQLPRYSNDEICRDRLLYAVRNCVEMDGDFRLADTEMTGWTGISPTDQLRI